MVTLKDIAKEAGVSVMTVSNIVNGNYTKVSKETTEHVQKIISQMGYVPNASARSLAKSKTNIIAIIMRGEENENPMLNPYYSAMVGAMIRKIQQHGYYAMVNIMKSHQDILQSLRTWNVDGAIFLGLFDDEIEAGMPELPQPRIERHPDAGSALRAGSHALHLPLRQQEAVFLSGGGGYLTAAFRGDGGIPRHPAGTGLFHTGFLQIVTYIGENHVRIIRKISGKAGT